MIVYGLHDSIWVFLPLIFFQDVVRGRDNFGRFLNLFFSLNPFDTVWEKILHQVTLFFWEQKFPKRGVRISIRWEEGDTIDTINTS